jgi:hypothetical protein
VLRKRSAGCEQQDDGGSGEGFDHVRGPSRMKVHAGPPLWPDNETSGSIAADHCAQTSRSRGSVPATRRIGGLIPARLLRRAPSLQHCGSHRCWSCRIALCRP